MLFRTVTLLLLAAPLAAPQASDDWLSAKEWWGQITYEVKDVGADQDAEWTLGERLDINVHLDKRGNGLAMTWPGKLEFMDGLQQGRFQSWTIDYTPGAAGTQWISGEGTSKTGAPGSSVTTKKSRSGLAILGLTAMFQVDIKTGTYGFYFSGPSAFQNQEVKTLEEITVESSGGSGSRTTRRRTTGAIVGAEAAPLPVGDLRASNTALFVWGQKLPKAVTGLEGSMPIPMRGRGQASGLLKWTFSPNPPPALSLELEAKGDTGARWEDWRPVGGPDEKTPGSSVTLTARIVSAGALSDKPHYFKIRLTDVSRERGVCINFPEKPEADPPLDFSFRPADNPDPDLLVTETAVWTVNAKSPEFKVKLACFDYGAWGEATAEAVLDSGRRLFAHVKNVPAERSLRLPHRKSDSKIATVWNSPGPDEADDDAAPTGYAPAKGDGLTNYEEYRGFMVKGVWTEGDPAKKDFFVRDETGGLAEPGIRLFQKLSQLEVHRLTADEFPPTRIINQNHTEGAHKVDQHGIRIVSDPSFGEQAEAQPVLHFQTPKDIHRVVVGSLPSVPPPGSPISTLENGVAHELFHCCNVWHHGDTEGEGPNTWVKGPTGITEGRRTITVVDEAGTDIGSLVSFPNLGGVAKFLSIGVRHGRYSGDRNCVMHYDDGWARFDDKDANKRILFSYPRAILGIGLCTGKDGTPPNDRFGDATFGNCTGQVHVNDGVPPRTR